LRAKLVAQGWRTITYTAIHHGSSITERNSPCSYVPDGLILCICATKICCLCPRKWYRYFPFRKV